MLFALRGLSGEGFFDVYRMAARERNVILILKIRRNMGRGRSPAIVLLATVVLVELAGCDYSSSYAPDVFSLAEQEFDRRSAKLDALIVEPSGATVSHEFMVRNQWNVPVQLEVSGKSCSCLDVSIEPETVPPMGTGTITLTGQLDSMTQVQKFDAFLEAAKPETMTRLALDLAIPSYARIDFPQPAPHAKLKHGATTDLNYTFIVHGDSRQLRSSQVEVQSKKREIHTTVVATELVSRENNIFARSFTCTTRFSPDFQNAISGNGTVSLRILYGRFVVEKSLSFEYSPPIKVRPSSLFYNAGAGTLEKSIALDGGSTAFAIRRIELPEFIQYEELDSGSTTRHRVSFKCNTKVLERGASQFNLNIHTDHPEQPIVIVPLYFLDLTTL